MSASPEEQAFDLHMEEYRSLRAEILAAQAERRNIDRLGAAAAIGVYGWLLTNGATATAPFFGAPWALPSLIALVCLLLSGRLTKGIRTAGRYLGLIEARYADPHLSGWHETLTTIRISGKAPQAHPEARWHMETVVELDRQSRLSANFWRICLVLFSIISFAAVLIQTTGRIPQEQLP